MNQRRLYLLYVWLLALLLGCAAAPATPALPLAVDQPTFLFFYTDN
ncbi:MAG: hypothetical protein K8I30_08990 [Anaerolineae bacterium]|nr:hypothetical protein [Anaerolineae bacterium]